MKKLDVISNKIKSSNINYFGRGHFEDIVKENSQNILSWLEDLIPIQEQIKNLNELGFDGIQKRNYVRILTKIFSQEYNHFIAMNIILRDIDSISAVYKGIHDTRKQYDTLLEHSRLKFPGKHQKFIDFHTYQQFVSFYKEDLINRAINFDIDATIKIEPNQQYIYNVNSSSNQNREKKIDRVEIKNAIEPKIEANSELEDKLEDVKIETKEYSGYVGVAEEKLIEIKSTQENKGLHNYEESEQQKSSKSKKEKTNWVQVLLKGI